MTARAGSRPGDRAAVLVRDIPAGGFGRPLTATERRAARALGWSLSERAIVVRASGRADLGVVYNPAPRRLGGGYDNAGIYVELR